MENLTTHLNVLTLCLLVRRSKWWTGDQAQFHSAMRVILP
jgi:hypothetical protein